MEHDSGREMSYTATTSSQQQEEGVLNDVLQELDRERTRRAELEAQMRVLAEENVFQSTAPAEDQQRVIEKREWIALETERNELMLLLEALTRDNEAISAASKPTSSSAASIPVHVVRLLEVMPWDQRARQNTIATEEVYEWQVYDVKGGKWTSQLRQFPPFFRTMPITKPTHTMDENPSSVDGLGRNISRRIFGGERPPRQCVMTNSSTTRVLNINDGFPLPKDGGTWQWIGGWRIDKRVVASPQLNCSKKTKVDCDDDGWSYAESPRHFLTNPTELCWDSPGETGEASIFRRRVRRRKWTRRRALLSYPFASERTKQYLKSIAENAVLEVTTSKLNDQLVETKVQLTQCEEKLLHNEDIVQKVERLASENARLEVNSMKLRKELTECEQRLKESRKELSMSSSGKVLEQGTSGRTSTSDDGLRRPRLEDVDKIRSALTNFVSDTRVRSDDGTAPDSDGDDSCSSSPSQKANEAGASDSGMESFDWKRFGRGAVFDKIKRSPAVKSLPSWRSPSPAGAAAVSEEIKETEIVDRDLALPTLK